MNDDRASRDRYVATVNHGPSGSSLVRPRRCRQCGADVMRSDKRCPICGQPMSIGAVKR